MWRQSFLSTFIYEKRKIPKNMNIVRGKKKLTGEERYHKTQKHRDDGLVTSKLHQVQLHKVCHTDSGALSSASSSLEFPSLTLLFSSHLRKHEHPIRVCHSWLLSTFTSFLLWDFRHPHGTQFSPNLHPLPSSYAQLPFPYLTPTVFSPDLSLPLTDLYHRLWNQVPIWIPPWLNAWP